MSRNWFRKDFDYLIGDRLQRVQPYSKNHKRCAHDRPKHLMKQKIYKKNGNGNNQWKFDAKKWQQKCSTNFRNVKYTFTDQPLNSRLTLEPKLDILNTKTILDEEIKFKWKPGIFSNSKFVHIKNKNRNKNKHQHRNDYDRNRKNNQNLFDNCKKNSYSRQPIITIDNRQSDTFEFDETIFN